MKHYKYSIFGSLLLLILFGIKSGLYAQTDSLERKVFHDKLLTKEVSQDDYTKNGPRWIQLIKKIGKYPDLPLDQNNQVHYKFLTTFANTSKEKLFTRTLEWLASNYGLFPVNLYSNLDDGKIILNSNFYIDNTYSCSYTGVISIRNEKIRVEFINIGYQAYFPGHNSGDTWIPDQTINYGINLMYPVILKNPSEWNQKLDLFKSTNEQFSKEVVNLWDYINKYDSNNTF